MYDTKTSEQEFANEDTICRRAWIEKALASVRSIARRDAEATKANDKTEKPRLYVVQNNRSG
jgi:hypothetical protein